MKQKNKNIVCLTSAGYSSVMMAIKLREIYKDHNIINIMANTSKEREESLVFMNECDKYFNLNLVWVEAVINEESGYGTTYKVVDFENLKRKGELFEQGIKKYGIPCKINKWCNRELKIVPIKKYVNHIFGINNYSTAIGYRIDEMDRIAKDYLTNNHFYPLMDLNIDSRERNRFWLDKHIQIKIPAYKGNCDVCFEKSTRKKLTIYKEEPELFDWWIDMEKKYSKITIDGKDSYNSFAENGGMHFNRSNVSMLELVEMAKQPFKKATDEYIYENDLFDIEGECGEACRIEI